MDAVEFLKQYSRMVASDVQPFAVPSKLPYEEIVAHVEQWSKEHPAKTRQSEFLKQHPDAEISDDGYPSVAPCQLYKDIEEKDENGVCCKNCEFGECRCAECRRDFWLKEIE